MASTTVTPAKNTAVPEVPIAADRAVALSWPAIRFSR
jgi:hypothetical protein